VKKTLIKYIAFLVMTSSTLNHAKDGVDVKFKNLGNVDELNVKISGRIQLETAALNGVMNAQTADVNDAGTTSADFYNRRTWIALRGDAGNNWAYKVQFDLRDGNDRPVRFNELSVHYKGFGPMAKISLGKLKEPSSYADYSSSKHHTFNELAAYVSTWDTGRNYGLQLSGSNNRLNYATGIFDNGNEESGKQMFAFIGRASYDFINTDTGLFHFGGQFSHRDSERTSWGQRLGSSKSDRLTINFDQAESETLYALELLGKKGSFHYQTEYLQIETSAGDAGQDVTGEGFYGQVAYILTGEVRPYKNGFWGGIKPKSPKGAWEIAARYEFMDTQDSGVLDTSTIVGGTKSEITTLALNYYYSPKIRISLNALRAETDGKVNGKDSGNALSLKLWTYF